MPFDVEANDKISEAIYAHKFKTQKRSPAMIQLPTKPNVPKTGWPESDLWLVYGSPKIGKTTLASQFPDPIILDLEHGAGQTSAHVLPIKTMDDLRQAHELLDGPEGNKFKTVVIDSIDVVYEFVEQETCAYLSEKFKTTINNIEEASHGAGWSEARKRLLGIVEAWKQLGKTIVFIAHAKAVSSENGTLQEKAKTIDLPGKLAHRFPARVDTIAFCYGQREKVGEKWTVNRKISFQPYESLEAGSRREALQNKVIDMSFKEIYNCFENPKAVKTTKINGNKR